MDKFEKARRKEKLQELKILPFCIYAAMFGFLGCWVMLSDSLTVFETTLDGFGKVLWFSVVGVMVGFSILLATSSLIFIVFVHLLAIELKTKVNTWRVLSRSFFLLAIGYIVFYFMITIERWIRHNVETVNDFASKSVYRFDLLEAVSDVVLVSGSVVIAGACTYAATYFVTLPSRVNDLAEDVKKQTENG